MNETTTRMSQRDRHLDAPLSYPRVVGEPRLELLEDVGDLLAELEADRVDWKLRGAALFAPLVVIGHDRGSSPVQPRRALG